MTNWPSVHEDSSPARSAAGPAMSGRYQVVPSSSSRGAILAEVGAEGDGPVGAAGAVVEVILPESDPTGCAGGLAWQKHHRVAEVVREFRTSGLAGRDLGRGEPLALVQADAACGQTVEAEPQTAEVLRQYVVLVGQRACDAADLAEGLGGGGEGDHVDGAGLREVGGRQDEFGAGAAACIVVGIERQIEVAAENALVDEEVACAVIVRLPPHRLSAVAGVELKIQPPAGIEAERQEHVLPTGVVPLSVDHDDAAGLVADAERAVGGDVAPLDERGRIAELRGQLQDAKGDRLIRVCLLGVARQGD
ncbi:MAG: hypothetical protein KatS3mg087_0899 [Patescibacteria group bacterium]|nr:MAG: hypothetical protein KatS3mg087_0899 [Patescibacteria group bacterium]